MNNTITTADVSASSDKVWDALVTYEDTGSYGKALAVLGNVSEVDRQLFKEGAADIDRADKEKKAAAAVRAQYTDRAPVRRARCPKITGFDYERAILTSQGY